MKPCNIGQSNIFIIQRTFVGSTKQHLVSVMYNSKNESIVVATEFQGKNKGVPIANNETKESTYVYGADFSKDGHFFIIK